nr:MarR family winged helix-turn-helix transcriptional regulator [Pseudomonas luteola]
MTKHDPDLWFAFIRAHRLMIREIERRFTAAGLPNYAWYDVLWGLESSPDGSRRMYELADVLAIERYNLTRIIDRLVNEGLVTRARSVEDGRAAYATITSKGKSLRKEMWGVYQKAVQELFLSQFTSKQVEEVERSLAGAGTAARRSFIGSDFN